MATPSEKLVKQDGTAIKALIVDDEQGLRELLSMALQLEGWHTETAEDGVLALNIYKTFQPDIIILDIMMPKMNGIEVIKSIRKDGSKVPALFLTAKDGVADRIAGLTAGSDDYVTKPFSLEEVVTRLRGLVRRHVLSAQTNPMIAVGDLTLDEDTHEVRRNGTLIDLTATEFDLLRYMMKNPRKVLTKHDILNHVWNYDFGGKSTVVELYVSYLRKKVDALGSPMIHTIRGFGYALKPGE